MAQTFRTYQVCFSNHKLDNYQLTLKADFFSRDKVVTVEYVTAASCEGACQVIRNAYPSVKSAVAFQCYNPI